MIFWISIIFIEIFLEQSIWLCKWVSCWCHRLSIFHVFCSQKLWKSHISATRMQNNVCSDIFWYGDMHVLFTCLSKEQTNNRNVQIVIYFYTKYMENCEAMRSSTHSFAYSYWVFKKYFVENYENSKFHIFLIFYPIYIKFSLFCSKCFNLSNLDQITPLRFFSWNNLSPSAKTPSFLIWHTKRIKC